MGSRGKSKAALLADWVAQRRPERIGDTELEEAGAILSPISSGHLRRLVRRLDVPLDPLIEGVVQEDFEELERTLLALEREYSNSNRDRARRVRQCVIEAKDHARWAMRRLAGDPAKAGAKEEMLLWLLTWLENPALFPVWVQLRKRQPPCVPPRPLL